MSDSELKASPFTHRNPADPPSIKLAKHLHSDTIEVDVQLVTPMLGGGALQRAADSDGWLRPSALKGHLRFWWRALHAHEFDSVLRMRTREAELFGAPARFARDNPVPLGGPGLFQLLVTCPERPTTERFDLRPNDPLHYVYFPGRKEKDRPAATLVRTNAKGSVTLRFTSASSSSDRGEIRDALRTWLLLGGIGSRTRRGAGSLKVTRARNLPGLNSRSDLVAFLKTLLQLRTLDSAASPACFSLARIHAALVGQAVDDAASAHASLIQAWITARTGRRGKTRIGVGLQKKEDRPRLGSAEPRHASSVILSVVPVGTQFVPLVIATRPHVACTPRDEKILNQALGAFHTFSTISL